MSYSIPSEQRYAADAEAPAPLIYTITIDQPDAHYADITIEVPTDGRTLIDLMMARWSPGFYRIEPYAEQVHDLAAHAPDGTALGVERPAANRWRVHANDAPLLRVTYRLVCESATVTTNWIGSDFALLNGPATFVTLAEQTRRPHIVTLIVPATWTTLTGLSPVGDEHPQQYRADDFDTLVDAPLVLGNADVVTFVVEGCPHTLVAVGDRAHWDGQRAAGDLEPIVRAHRHFWNGLPYQQYVFLIVCREGGGGLEHSNSTLVTARPSRMGTPDGYNAWVTLVAHEFFHAWNVKRLRPTELGPFDYEQQPRTTSLWIAEGLTCYYTDLLLCRAGLHTPTFLLGVLSAKIAELQNAPGRLVQTLEQSSYDVWDNSFSGLNPTDTTVSYYTKGHVVGFLLDAHIRRVSDNARSLDDVMRLAYARYGGDRGFTATQFRQTAEEVAGVSLTDWLAHAIASTEELDYSDALAWFGLRFAGTNAADPAAAWRLEVDELRDQEATQRRHDWHGAPERAGRDHERG